jgi:hypothetical protein
VCGPELGCVVGKVGDLDSAFAREAMAARRLMGAMAARRIAGQQLAVEQATIVAGPQVMVPLPLIDLGRAAFTRR